VTVSRAGPRAPPGSAGLLVVLALLDGRDEGGGLGEGVVGAFGVFAVAGVESVRVVGVPGG
jgi:hypothetical protein